MASKIIGCGGYLPEKVLTNDDLAKFIDTSDEWIRTRTGIRQRHIAAEGEFTSHMAHKAALAAIKDANINSKDIDLIVVCSNTPDNSFPGIANKLQGYLDLGQVPSFDIQAICSGFIYGIHVVDSMIKSGKYKTVLLVCADKMSALLDWQDRSTCVLFGDGAGAVILQHCDSNAGVIDSNIYSDGSMYDILYTDGGVSTNGKSGRVQMKGQEVFRRAIEKMSESVKQLLEVNGMSLSDIDHLVPHQANLRIIDSIAARLDIDSNKIVTTIERHANCSAASIPLALSELKSLKGIKPGKIVVFTAFGAGATWGAAIVRW
ncbi:Ketoacyl-ACP synthase III [Candidatus Megaera venefica]|uniref:Beta-ketoacyl-[acyl-carrier-protein] synthase III n=1 Tax=Candidatus Megaera venefica TaxID=2055910 RepID=A0ABU5NC27_9RICK|nr:beta-ketoacyl-ACP synthase III [Candidatus Megaera venefica]MEA0970687.1 Ketoacyl-ACP synthase III [Candidatus Megaera venefica]